MNNTLLHDRCTGYMKKLCTDIPERSVGSEGNRQATAYVHSVLSSFGWETALQEFDAMDWNDGGAKLRAGNADFEVFVSPYSPGFSGCAPLAAASDLPELERGCSQGRFTNAILLVHGELAKEQLMPKNFVFYNPEEHRRIISLLENSEVKALICATGRNAALAGGVYPFPLIEDGDFTVPSVYMTEEEGQKLLPHVGKEVVLQSNSTRIPGKGYNVIGRTGMAGAERIVITAHIDAKKGTPGAIDNATGVSVLLILAELLKDYSGNKQIEIVAFNGEDYYSVPGQMEYIKASQDRFNTMLLNINIDGAGYKDGTSAFSLFDVPNMINQKALEIINTYPGIVEGVRWPQGDHSIFLQYGIPAVAVSSRWFIEHIDTQDITHTAKDSLDIVDCSKIAEIAVAVTDLVRAI